MQFILLLGLHGGITLFEPFSRVRPSTLVSEIKPVGYPNDGPYDYVSAVNHVRSALPKVVNFILIAESFSGPIAIRLASERLPGLKGIILVSTFARSPWAPFSLSRVPNELLTALPKHSIMSRWFLSGSCSVRGWGEELSDALNQIQKKAFISRLRAIDTIDVRTELYNINVPILYLQATRDLLVPPWRGTEINNIAKFGSMHRVKGPHMLLQKSPSSTWTVITDWVRNVGLVSTPFG